MAIQSASAAAHSSRSQAGCQALEVGGGSDFPRGAVTPARLPIGGTWAAAARPVRRAHEGRGAATPHGRTGGLAVGTRGRIRLGGTGIRAPRWYLPEPWKP